MLLRRVTVVGLEANPGRNERLECLKGFTDRLGRKESKRPTFDIRTIIDVKNNFS